LQHFLFTCFPVSLPLFSLHQCPLLSIPPPPTLLSSLPPMQIPYFALLCFSSRAFSSANAALFSFLQTAGPSFCCSAAGSSTHVPSLYFYIGKPSHIIPSYMQQINTRALHMRRQDIHWMPQTLTICASVQKWSEQAMNPARVPFILDVAALGCACYRLHLLARAADHTKLAAGAKRLCPFRSQADLLSAKQQKCACSRSTGVVPVLESFQHLTSCYLKPGFALFPRRACLQLPALASAFQASSFNARLRLLLS